MEILEVGVVKIALWDYLFARGCLYYRGYKKKQLKLNRLKNYLTVIQLTIQKENKCQEILIIYIKTNKMKNKNKKAVFQNLFNTELLICIK